MAVLSAFGASEAGTLAIDFQNPQTLYAATERGTFKSVDGGDTWTPRNAGMPIATRPLFVNFLVMDPVNPRILYAATQDQGLFKTTDGANTWVQTNTALPAFTALAVDPKTPTTLYAAAGQGTQGMLGSAGRVDHLGRIYKSIDGGLSWAPSSAGVADPMISAVAITSQAPHIVYAVTALGGVVKSADAGSTWHPAGTGITSKRITALAIDARSPDTLYVGTADRGVFKSVDGGASWGRADRGLTNKVVSSLVVDPLVQSTIYAVTTTDVFRSIDAGSNWIQTGSTPAHQAGLAIDPLKPSAMYLAGGPGHVFKSQDVGVTWKRVNTWPTDLVAHALAVDPTHPEILYAGVRVDDERGVFKSSDGGASWRRSDSGLDTDAMILAIDPGHPSTLYAATTTGVFKSTDGGASWKASGSGLPQRDAVGALAVHPSDSATVYAGTLNTGMFKSTDAGGSWRPTGAALSSRNVVAIVVDSHSPATVYAVLEDLPAGAVWMGGPRARDRIGGVFKSVDGGTTWTGSDSGLPLFVNALAIHPRAPGILYASVGGADVFKSGDGGATWTVNSNGLTAPEVLGLAVNPQSVYSRTRSGVFKMTDGGDQWIQVNAGLPNQPALDILALAVDPRDPGIVYAGTATHGIFKSTDGGENWRPINAGLAGSGTVAARPAPGGARGPAKLISTLDGSGRAIIEAIGVGERTQISRREDCNTCQCDVQRIAPTEYVDLACRCTMMACRRP